MHRVFVVAGVIASMSLARRASALVDEPNGQQVPLDSKNGEVQLYTFFQSPNYANDPSVDWQADAATSPSAFSPLCGFTATFMLHCAGSDFDFGWYNVADPSKLFTLIPGTQIAQQQSAGLGCQTPFNPFIQFSGTDIRHDPNYQGGLIGFALFDKGNAGYPPHYTDFTLDKPQCTSCPTPGPWVTALVYPSKKTPNAYYVAFEDGAVSQTSFANDGDFNDDVVFVTGVTCAGGGLPCDTGKQGICAQGLTQCTGTGTICVQLNQPAKETCNGVDDDCNGQVDDGKDLCQTGFVCDKGSCVQACDNGEFACPGNLVCDADGFCVDPACKDKQCPSGQVCVAGACKAPCDGIVCPYPSVCLVGACVDPCAHVTCQSGTVCDQGVCIPSCDCTPCATGKACDTASGQCVESDCVGITCPDAGTHCAGGICVGDCAGAKCPAGQTCDGEKGCVASNGAGGAAASSTAAFVTTGSNSNGSGAANSGGAGGAGAGRASSSASSTAIGGFGSDGSPGSSGSCGCRLEGADDSPSTWFIAAALSALAARWRRRRTS